MSIQLPIHGRGASENPANRFEQIEIVRDAEFFDPDDPLPKTQFFEDQTQEILATNNSPDIPFAYSINPYRGCEHGCIYCYARPTHEYMGYSAGLDFETKILVKRHAAELLRTALRKKSWQPQTISLSGVTDPYQPMERQMRITRSCLEVLAEFRNPVGIITKNALVTRDIDLLTELAAHRAVAVFLSITSLNASLQQRLEPRASHPEARLRAIEQLRAAGIPVGVMVAPIIPGLTEDEIHPIIAAATNAGAQYAGYVVLKLPYAVKDLFQTWLNQHYPEKREKILNRIRELRNGELNDSGFGTRMTGTGPRADWIRMMFQLAKKKAGLQNKMEPLSTASFRIPGRSIQGNLFDHG